MKMRDASPICPESVADNEMKIQVSLLIDCEDNMVACYYGCDRKEAFKQMRRFLKTYAGETIYKN